MYVLILLLLLLLSYLIQSTKIELSSDALSESSKVSTTIDDNQELLWIVLEFLTVGNVALLAIYFSM